MEHYPDAWRALSAIQRDICVILAFKGPSTGAEIRTHYGVDNISGASISRNLQKLRDRSLVDRSPEASQKGLNALTERGREIVREAVINTGIELNGGLAKVSDT